MVEKRITTTRTGAATATGGYANTGTHNGDVVIASGPLPARSAYRDQVEQIFPWSLLDRSVELAELEAFCKADSGHVYCWWQAPAWAGKSALMATFALTPPPAVKVASFFITARWAGQSDRMAFLDAMLEQLAEIAGQPLPDTVLSSAKQRWFNRLLKEAAEACRTEGHRMILVVDGLDEDSGFTVGSNAHSIAALLPAVPPPNVRIIVAGRPDPPVPVDVPSRHPLRNSQIIRNLSTSAHALLARDDLERELAYLLDDDGIGHDLLAFVTASGGGLSEADLVELTGGSPWGVRRVLRSASGRTFTSRSEKESTPIFVLAHEELLETARACLGSRTLSTFRQHLHDWAQRYRALQWPATTSSYLLRGYHHLLRTLGDVERMTGLSADHARQDRMLEVTGGDALAFQEIIFIETIMLSREESDIAIMLRLAAARNRLFWRNRRIPESLPAVWIRLGNLERADAIADSARPITSFPEVVIQLVSALIEIGDITRVQFLFKQFEKVLELQDNPRVVARALPALVHISIQLNQFDRAQEFSARAIYIAENLSDTWGAHALADLAKVINATGDILKAKQILTRAESICRSIEGNDTFMTNVLLCVAETHLELGEVVHAKTIFQEIIDSSSVVMLSTITRAKLLLLTTIDQVRELATSFGEIDDREEASACALATVQRIVSLGNLDIAECTALEIDNWADQAAAWTILANSAIDDGDLERGRMFALRATAATRSQTNFGLQVRILAAFAEAFALTGESAQAALIARRTEDMLNNLDDTFSTVFALDTLSRTWARMNNTKQSLRIARDCVKLIGALELTHWRSRSLASIAETFFDIHEFGDAETLLQQAANIAKSTVPFEFQPYALADLTKAYIHMGNLQQAEDVCRTIESVQLRAKTLAVLATGCARAREIERARELASEAEALARSEDAGTFWQHQSLASVATALAVIGELERAENLIHSLPNLSDNGKTIAEIAQASPIHRAGHLLALALAHTDYYIDLLPIMAKISPDVVKATLRRILEIDQNDLMSGPE